MASNIPFRHIWSYTSDLFHAQYINVYSSLAVQAPRRLRFKVLSAGKLLVSWKEPKGDYDGYKFIYNSEPGKKQVKYEKFTCNVDLLLKEQITPK